MQNLGWDRLGCGLQENLIYIGPVKHFFLQKCFCQTLQTGHVFCEQPLRPIIVFCDKPPDFLVDLHGYLIAEVALTPHLPPKKNLFVLFAERQGTHLFAHAPLTDHLPREIRGPLEIVPRSSRHLLQDQLFCHTTSHENGKLIDQIRLRIAVPVIDGELHRYAQGTAPRNNGDFVDGICSGNQFGDQRVPGFMIGRRPFLLVAQDQTLPFSPHQYFVFGHLEIDDFHFFLIQSRGPERGFVDQVFQVGP